MSLMSIDQMVSAYYRVEGSTLERRLWVTWQMGMVSCHGSETGRSLRSPRPMV